MTDEEFREKLVATSTVRDGVVLIVLHLLIDDDAERNERLMDAIEDWVLAVTDAGRNDF